MQVNDSLVSFPDAKPFISSAGFTMVPVRMVSEQLGFQVGANQSGQTVEVTIKGKGRSITLTTGQAQAKVDGKAVQLDSPAQFSGGRVFVPLRFLTDTFGYLLQWDAANWIVIIGADGKYHAPAWYAPKTSPVISTAKQYMGVPYVFGGSTPGGFDCSGFVSYVFAKNGISLPRTSGSMYAASGKTVSSLQEGDLVFFQTSGKSSSSPSHVGIYLGNSQFISATTSSGVKIDSLNSSYWGPRYIGAKRV